MSEYREENASEEEYVSGEFDDSHPIPQRTVKRVWHKEYPNRPMPKIEAYNVPERSFKKTLKNEIDTQGRGGEEQEYGHAIPDKHIGGLLIKDEATKTYLILKRANSGDSVHRVVRHEVHHIAHEEGFGSEVHTNIHSRVAYEKQENTYGEKSHPKTVEMEAKDRLYRKNRNTCSDPFNLLNLKPIGNPSDIFFGTKKKSKSKNFLGF